MITGDITGFSYAKSSMGGKMANILKGSRSRPNG